MPRWPSASVAASSNLSRTGPIRLSSTGESNPTRVAQRKVSKAEMMTRAKNIFSGRIRNRECPKALGVYSSSDPVCRRPWC
jgi:hypothetical protein